MKLRLTVRRTISEGEAMKTLSNKQLKDAIRQHYAWPGGYEIYGITSDGALLCCDCMRKEYYQIAWSRRHECNDGWRVIALTLDCEFDDTESCAHCNKAINEEDES